MREWEERISRPACCLATTGLVRERRHCDAILCLHDVVSVQRRQRGCCYSSLGCFPCDGVHALRWVGESSASTVLISRGSQKRLGALSKPRSLVLKQRARNTLATSYTDVARRLYGSIRRHRSLGLQAKQSASYVRQRVTHDLR